MWRLGRKVHLSWLVAIGWLAFLAGVMICLYLPYNFGGLLWLAIGTIATLVSLLMRRSGLIILLIIGALVLGIARASPEKELRQYYESLVSQTVTVIGQVNEDPTVRADALSISFVSDRLNDRAASGLLYVTLPADSRVGRGDRLQLSGKVTPGFGSYDATLYRPTLLSRSEATDGLTRLRDWFADRVRSQLSGPAAGLGLGFLIGEKSSLASDLVEALQIAGMTHVVVASGYNLTILVRLTRRLLLRVSKFSAATAAVVMILGFVGVTGFSPSMTRAGMVALFSLGAWYYGRRFHPFVLLTIVAGLSVLIHPQYIWYDVGWWLSFMAFVGVMVLAPLLQRYFFGEKSPGTIRQILGETVAAHVMTLPIIILVFSQISHVAILSNMLVLPLVPLAMLLTFLVGVAAATVPAVAAVIAWPTQHLLDYMIAVIYWSSEIDWAQSDVSLSMGWIVGLYALVAAAIVYLWWRTRLDLRDNNLVV